MTSASSRMVALALTTVLIAAVLLRVLGLTFGLPAVYNPDEVSIMNRALALGQNAFNPRNFVYPSLYLYALFAWEGAWFVLGRVTGHFHDLAAFERAFFVDPSSIYVAGRLFSVLCGIATVWATWRLGRRLFGEAAGLAAAALLAVAPLAVRDAHYVKHDVPVTLLIVLAHLAAARAATVPALSRWALAGATAGLAVSTHYYAVFVMAPVMLLAWSPGDATRHRYGALGQMAIAGASAAAAFVLTSPFLLLDFGTAYRDMVANREIVVDRATTSVGAFGSLAFYLEWLVRDSVGLVAAALAAAGLFLAVRGGWRTAVVTIAFPATFVLFLANTVPASRYLNAVLPFVALLAGAAFAALWSRTPALRAIAGVLLTAAVVEAAGASLVADRFMSQTDTRTRAAEWFAREVPDGASVLVQPYSVPLRMSRAALVEALTTNLGDASRASVKFQRQLALDPYPSPAYRTIFLGTGGLDADKIYVDPAVFDATPSLAPLRARSVTYVVMKRYNVEDPSMASLDQALEREGRLVAAFSPYKAQADSRARLETAPFLHNTDARMAPALERPGPTIEIWRID